jgi:HEAT repeat protein
MPTRTAVLVLLAVLSARTARAAEPLAIELTPGQSWEIRFDPGPPAALLVHAPPSWAEYRVVRPPGWRPGDPRVSADRPAPEFRLELPPPAPGADAQASASVVSGPDDRRLGRVTLTEEGRTYEALVAVAGTPLAALLAWAGWTTPTGDLGERLGAEIQIADADGDGGDDVLVGRTFEGVTVCGQDRPALLHRRAWDWASATMRPVSAPRPGLDAAVATVLVPAGERLIATPPAAAGGAWAVSPASPTAPDAALVPLLEYRAASSTYGDGGSPLAGMPPRGLEDMDGRTGWAEGVGGTGRLEFAVARTVTDRLEARWVAVRPADDTDENAARTRNRPRSLLVVDGAGHSWRLDLPDDDAARRGGVSWFELPEPVGGGCLAAALVDAWPATSGEGRRANVTWISDLQAFALLSLRDDSPSLQAVLEDEASSLAAERALRALGAAAVATLRDLAPSLGPTAAARAVDFLRRRTEPEAADAVAALLLARDADTARAVRAAVEEQGEAATPALRRLFDRAEPGARPLALELLGAIGGPEGLATLLACASAAVDAERAPLRAALVALLGRHPECVADVLAQARGAIDGGAETTATDLLRAIPFGEASIRAAAAEALVALLGRSTDFAVRYHLLRRAGDLMAAGEAAPAAAVLEVAKTAEEPELRTEAARALAGGPADLDLAPLLDDPWPGVREAAAKAIGRRGIDREIRALAARFAGERWPLVRAAAAEAFLGGRAWPGDDAAQRLLEDPSPSVRERVVDVLGERGDEPALRMLAGVVERHRERLALRQAALAALARHCWSGLKPLVVRAVEWSVGGEPSAADQALALDAIRVLGTAGPAGVRSLLEEIVREAPVPPLLAAALAALGDLGEADAAATIEPYRRHADPGVAAAAAAALQALERGRAGRRCTDR